MPRLGILLWAAWPAVLAAGVSPAQGANARWQPRLVNALHSARDPTLNRAMEGRGAALVGERREPDLASRRLDRRVRLYVTSEGLIAVTERMVAGTDRSVETSPRIEVTSPETLAGMRWRAPGARGGQEDRISARTVRRAVRQHLGEDPVKVVARRWQAANALKNLAAQPERMSLSERERRVVGSRLMPDEPGEAWQETLVLTPAGVELERLRVGSAPGAVPVRRALGPFEARQLLLEGPEFVRSGGGEKTGTGLTAGEVYGVVRD